MSQSKFLTGALILTVAGITVKIIGAVNKIFISRLLGGEGIGLYQMAYPIYYILMSIAAAGIPIAISIMVSEKLANKDMIGANRVFTVSFFALLGSGLLFGILLYVMADWLVDMHFIYDPRAIYALKALAPAIPIVTVVSCYRGYFQGFQDMVPTGVSQIGEQIVRVVTMLVFSWALLSWGLAYAAAGAAFSTFPGALMALIVIGYFYYRQRHVRRDLCEAQPEHIIIDSTWTIVKRLFILAIPVSLANIMMPIMAGIDLIIVPRRLVDAGLTINEATTAFGYLTGMANSLVNLPVILTASLAASIVPAISSAKALGNKEAIKERIRTAIKVSNLFNLPAFIGLCVLATPISVMLYATPYAGAPIAVLSLSIVLLGLQQVTTGVLQGLGRTAIPMINLGISMIVKIILTWLLTAIPYLGVNGAAWATNVDFAIALILNMIFIYYFIDYRIDWYEAFKILLSASIMGLIVYFMYGGILPFLGNSLSIFLCIMAAFVSYLSCLIIFKAINRDDLLAMPFIGKRLQSYYK